MAKKLNVWEHNFAQNPAVRDRIQKHFSSRIKQLRDQRSVLQLEWMKFFNMWNVKHDENHTYNGRAKLYIPEVRKAVESQARHLVDSAFPNDDFFDVSPGDSGTRKGAQVQKSIRRWQMEESNLRLAYHVFQRQNCLYGTSVAYIPWRKEVEHIFRKAKDPKTGKVAVTRQMVEKFNGPDFVVKDLFKWYALDPTALDFQDSGCLELGLVDRFDLIRRDKLGMLWGLKDIMSNGAADARRMEEFQEEIQRAETVGLQLDAAQGYAGEASLSKDDDADRGLHSVATIFARIEMPEAIDPETDEDPRLPIPMMIEIYDNGHVGLVRRNPFWHQRAPYLAGKYILPNTGEFYGQGIPWATQYMQYELNSKVEQAMDSATLALNPIAFLDPASASTMSEFNVEPGALWFVHPNGVKFGSIPDVTPTAYNAMAQLRAQIQDFSDLNPALPSQFAGKARTATQSEIVSNTISIDTRAFQNQMELMVLQPMMGMWERLTDQNIDEKQVIMILGRRATDWHQQIVTPNQTLGSYRYFWKASSSQQSKSILSRQIIDFMKVAGSLPPDQAAGLKFDFAEAARMLWTEGMGLPDADKIFGGGSDIPSQDPQVVIEMIKLGMDPEVQPNDDNAAIMKALDAEMAHTKDEGIKRELARQILMHREQLKMKFQMAQRAQQMQQMAMMQAAQAQAQGGGQPQQQQQQGGGLQGSGNRTQLSPNASVGNMASGVRA